MMIPPIWKTPGERGRAALAAYPRAAGGLAVGSSTAARTRDVARAVQLESTGAAPWGVRGSAPEQTWGDRTGFEPGDRGCATLAMRYDLPRGVMTEPAFTQPVPDGR